MSVCRFSEGDVYVFYNLDGVIECCSCQLTEERRTFKARDEETMIAHLDEHISAGHTVPAEAFDRLREEIASRV